ncbi:N-acetylglucosaminyl-diphospho-decaprenol L-rhamnosyltransferase [Sporomusa ovata DSM 2662]|uniref:Glycosyltransferase domain containing protein n=1 Tax=Sporomusa ovata TaxID=2378 RepID=A0A0U1KT06_9FIRM|nr:glycosyltransferase family 2 protein [Sporomusa ovata]EQB26467.1 putative glycosyltransferase [Sporomusa ovata DSM 2662]CQR70551.1 Glycosyltransferase domain containing protein [Sporomusa ovata]
MDVNKPLISIIVVTYNGEHHLRQCIPSLKEQTYPKELLEIIVVDNCSSDKSLEYLQQYHADVRIICNDSNQGFAKPNNQAAELAKGEYLALINNDMIAKNDWLEQLVATAKHSQAECIAGTILNWEGSRIDCLGGGLSVYGHAVQKCWNEPIETLESHETEEETIFACGGAMLIKRDVYLKIGGFDEDFFAYCEDVDLGWRLWILGYRVVTSPKAVTYHRHNGTSGKFSKYRRIFHQERNALGMIYKNYDSNNYLKFLVGAILRRFARLAEQLRINPKQYYFTHQIIWWHSLRNKIRLIGRSSVILVQVIAIAGFTHDIRMLTAKRQKIQEQRVRTDEEVMRLFNSKSTSFKQQEYKEYFEDSFRFLENSKEQG